MSTGILRSEVCELVSPMGLRLKADKGVILVSREAEHAYPSTWLQAEGYDATRRQEGTEPRMPPECPAQQRG
jgi:hypothetical protein